MNPHALTVLEFDKVRRMLLRWAFSASGRERIEALAPDLDLQAIQRSQERISEWKQLELRGEAPAFREVPDLRSSLHRLPRGNQPLSAEELVTFLPLLQQLDALHRLARGLRAREVPSPRLTSLLDPIEDFGFLTRRIETSLSPSGEILDSASAELARIRRELHETQRSASELLAGMLERLSGDRREDAFVTLRDGRYVVAIRASDRELFPGLLHGRSQTGHSVLVEPLDALEANNRVAERQADEKAEEHRILSELTDALRERAPALGASERVISEIDRVRAGARLAIHLRAEPPRVLPEVGLRIAQGRHPILADAAAGGGPAVVPLDLEMTAGAPVLVISGPNMGGKTVALKTAGLLVAMAKAGLHVPAGPGTELPDVDEVFVDLGDEQSIEADLSTFAGHLRNIGRLWEHATDRSLALLDELGGGTDPEEGAAISMALLEGLAKRGTLTVATTHLTSLKLFVQDRPGMANASMEFDAVTLSPRFRLKTGEPGRSRAFEIARRVLPGSDLLDRAEPFRSPQLIQLDRLFSRIDEERVHLAAERDRLERERTELSRVTEVRAQLAEKLRQRIASLREARSDILRSVYAEGEREIASLREQIDEARKRSEAESERAVEAARHAERQIRKRAMEAPRPRVRRPSDQIAPERVRPGLEAWLPEVRAVVRVERVRPDANKVRVEWQGRYLEVGLQSLEEIPREAERSVHLKPVRVPDTAVDDQPIQREVDLRGCRVEEALESLDRFLDQAVLRHLGQVRIVHGKGTGTLKREVERALGKHPLVSRFRGGEPQEGGWGVTVAELGD